MKKHSKKSNQKKTAKRQPKKKRRKNPIDEEFLRWLRIEKPLGLPEKSKEAFQLGEMFGIINILYFCKKGDFVSAWTRVEKVEKKFDKNALPFVEEGLPSDAFMLGIYKGVIKAGNICLDKAKTRTYLGGIGIGSSKHIDQYIGEIENSPLYKKYYDYEKSDRKLTRMEILLSKY